MANTTTSWSENTMKAIYRPFLNFKWDYIIASIITSSLTQTVSLKEKARIHSPELIRANLPPLLTKESYLHFLFVQSNFIQGQIVQSLTNFSYSPSLSNSRGAFLG